ncbi:MAG TPA: transglutaminase family protein [Opitutales bacterium]|jgi:transglutaminase-like putative cysteine protease|nr:transglutaminase family protein [Opitutales bacterium]
MRFRVTHRTEYAYVAPASESFAELRVWPRDTQTQKVLARQLTIEPRVPVDNYVDYFGNHVEFFSVPFRHQRLAVEASAEVETYPAPDLREQLEVNVAEARQIVHSQMYKLFDFLQPSDTVPLGDVLRPLKQRFFDPGAPLGESLLKLNRFIHSDFAYSPGVTDISTPLTKVIQQRRGVCQDFAHLMLSVLRTAGIPARYVSGYIEHFDPEKTDPALVGAAASHAWVEVFLPGGEWYGLDPTNNQAAGERHVVTAVGRDYHDVAPMRGTYKGAHDQRLQVIVMLKRQALNGTGESHTNNPFPMEQSQQQTQQIN